MNISAFVGILLSFGYFHCGEAAAAAAGPPSNAPLGNALQNPWMVRRNPMLEVDPATNVDVFGHYGNRKFQDLSANEQHEVVEALKETAEPYKPEVGPIWTQEHAIQKAEEHTKANPGRSWNGGWYTTKPCEMSILHITRPDHELKSDLSLNSNIWQQCGRNNYLISYNRNAPDCRKGETLWIVSSGKQVLWSECMGIPNQAPIPSTTFPELVPIEDDEGSIFKLHEKFRKMTLENRRLMLRLQGIPNDVIQQINAAAGDSQVECILSCVRSIILFVIVICCCCSGTELMVVPAGTVTLKSVQ